MRVEEIINESRLGNAVETAQRMYDKYAGLNYTAYDRAVDHSQNYESNTPQYQYWIDVAREIDRLERADTAKKKKSNLEEARVRYEDLVLDYHIDGANVDVRAIVDGKQVGYVIFNRDGRTLFPDDLAVDAEYRGRGIAKKMYDWVKSLPQKFEIIRGDQTAMGKRFWDKNRGEHVDVWEEGVAKGVTESATVTRIDSKPITDFASNLNTYKHTDDWSQSGLDMGDDSYWSKRNIKPNTSKGLFAGDPHRTALYATGNANETQYVEYTENGQPVVYFDKKDLPAIRGRKTYLSVFDASDFRKLPSGEWFSERPSKPIKQIPINDPFKYIESQGWKIRITNDLNKVLKKVQQLQKVGKIDHYGAEGMNESKQGVAEDTVDEMALASYKTLGDFDKPGSFRGVDKRLVPHPKSEIKAAKFFEQTPYDFRLFFANKPGLGQYSEYGPMTPDQIVKVFGEEDAKTILDNHDDAITVVYVSNRGDEKVMMTPWIMAHRFGHAIQAGAMKDKWSAWEETQKLFFSTINRLLDEYYGKVGSVFSFRKANQPNYNLTPEYNALFNAIGTQRSSRTGQIRRPYEFMYELFAQYLGTGTITLNPLPTNLGYGRKVFGNPSKYLNIKSEFRDETELRQASEMLARDMELMFNDVLGNSVGKVYIM